MRYKAYAESFSTVAEALVACESSKTCSGLESLNGACDGGEVGMSGSKASPEEERERHAQKPMPGGRGVGGLG